MGEQAGSAELRDKQLLESYRALLSELVGNAGSTGVQRSLWPESLLPGRREEIAAAIERAKPGAIGSPDYQRLEAMATLLEQQFRPDTKVKSEFISTLLTAPVMISAAYAVWLAVRGEGWSWLIAAVTFAVGWAGALLVHFAQPDAGGGKRFLLVMARSVCTFLAFGGTVSLWLRLVFAGALGGVYQSIFVHFDFWGLAQAVIAFWIAWYYSKALGALYYFERAKVRTQAEWRETSTSTDSAAVGLGATMVVSSSG